ncbi:hypothetical protein X756_06425 [Mesorhizobium sp. LSHC412B00]|nr:hypothetical protein X756_06425 [Mesorhizobium sp. LSHC412B00]
MPAGEFQAEIQKTENAGEDFDQRGALLLRSRGGCRAAAAHGTDHAFLGATEHGKRLPGDDVVACRLLGSPMQ